MSFVRSADFTRFAQCRTLITIQRAALLHISRVAGDADSVAQYVKRAFRCLVWVGLSGGDGAEVEFAAGQV
ncbi:hypothetical protein AAAT57_08420, partial [Bifidobacterium longum]|uniref:hypothetical protein n=1 Tax=Bifidobacterium longum TaxID=216816 RepID=UPI0032C17B66